MKKKSFHSVNILVNYFNNLDAFLNSKNTHLIKDANFPNYILFSNIWLSFNFHFQSTQYIAHFRNLLFSSKFKDVENQKLQ